MRRRFAAASPIQPAMNSPSRRARAASTSSIRRRCSASAGADRVGVVDEHVDPHARVRSGDARHVAERAAGVRKRLVALDAGGAGLVDDDVGEHVGQVARERDELVVRGRLDRVREGAELADEAVNEGVALRARLRGRRQEPGRALEEPGGGMRGAVRLLAGDRVPADEAGRACGGRDDARLRRAGVGDGGPLAARLEHGGHLLRERRHRRRDHGQVGAGDRLGERARRLDGAALGTPGRARPGPGPTR